MADSSTIAIPVDRGRIGDPGSCVLTARVIRPRLRSVLRRIIAAVAERWERRATERTIHYLRTRKDLSEEFRIELERRFMGQ
jgi:hypothetical protein